MGKIAAKNECTTGAPSITGRCRAGHASRRRPWRASTRRSRGAIARGRLSRCRVGTSAARRARAAACLRRAPPQSRALSRGAQRAASPRAGT